LDQETITIETPDNDSGADTSAGFLTEADMASSREGARCRVAKVLAKGMVEECLFPTFILSKS